MGECLSAASACSSLLAYCVAITAHRIVAVLVCRYIYEYTTSNYFRLHDIGILQVRYILPKFGDILCLIN
jgi:hypothetical protein